MAYRDSSYEPVWRQFAAELYADFYAEEWLGRPAVIVRLHETTVTLDLVEVHKTTSYPTNVGDVPSTYSTTSITYFTRMRATFKNPTGHHFDIQRAGLFTSIGKLFGFHDIQIGDAQFDKEFFLKSSSPTQLCTLLSDAELRESIRQHDDFHLTTREHAQWFSGETTGGHDELSLEISEAVTDGAQLRALYATFMLVLRRLNGL